MKSRNRKRPSPFVSQARAFNRIARKFDIAGDHQKGDWYRYQAEMCLKRERERKDNIERIWGQA